MPVTLTLPWPPTANTYWRSMVINGSVRVLISAKGRQFRIDVRAAVLKRFGVLKPSADRMRVTIRAYPPDRRRRDLSNVQKATEDALTHAGVWLDDEQIDDLRTIRMPVSPPDGRIEVTIEKMPEPAGLFSNTEAT